MSNKKSGVLPLLVGAAAGAAAVFFSDKKNREMAKKKLAEGKLKAEKIKKEIEKNPEAFAKKTATQVQKGAKKIADQATVKAKKLVKDMQKRTQLKKLFKVKLIIVLPTGEFQPGYLPCWENHQF